ncbi:Crp/Fnr family transcriptional regulator [Microvirga pakistanensis]|uniref:Crp/Fnr family transcriptional regulator n=1 Tax=Microvirga pakistanensis TaxID=1682650 RepID=UPI00106D1D9F|nr:Crp/Fnr family transcriptional regulator [Microvirga pakistanensis]
MHSPQQVSIENRLLAVLSPEDFARLQPHLESVSLDMRQVLIEPNTAIAYVYFPEAGMSSVTNNSSGGKIEVGVVGREGMVGLPIVLGIDQTPYEHFMQIAGHGWRIAADDLEQAMAQSRSLHRQLLRYAQASHVQASETAFSNANSDVEARLARWLLMCHDRVDGDDIQVTHEFIAIMLGVRRPGVTVALHMLEGMHVIRAKRGLITVLDRAKLEELADDAYGLPEAEYTRLMGTEPRDAALLSSSAVPGSRGWLRPRP